MSEQKIFDVDDQRRLMKTQQIRENIIDELTEKGIPDCKEDRQMLMAALDGMDRGVFSKAKIKADATAGNSQQQTAALVSALLTHISAKPPSPPIEGVHVVVPTLPNNITVTDGVPGEKDIGLDEQTYDTFIQKFET